jgi:hypothetical protein
MEEDLDIYFVVERETNGVIGVKECGCGGEKLQK